MNLPALRNDTVIVRLEAARTALAEAKTIQQTKAISDVAAAAEIYARRQKLGEEAIDFAHAVKIEALRKLGEFLRDAPKAEGRAGPGRGKAGAEAGPAFTDAPTLAELGVDKKTSSLAQKLAELPEKDFEAVRDGHTAVGKALDAAHRSRRAEASPSSGNEADIESLRQELAACKARCRGLEQENSTLKARVAYWKAKAEGPR